jgi:hypothetical protein
MLAALLVPSLAQAWSHTGEVLVADDLPLRWSVEVDPQVANLTSEQVVADLKTAFAAWDEAACGVSTEFVGEVAYADPTEVPEGELHLTFAPLGDTGGAWVRLGAQPSSDPVLTRGGRVYTRLVPGAWVVNTDLDFASDEAIRTGDCADQLSFSSVLGILIGDRLGLGVSFDRSALMSGRLSTCEIVRPGPDDQAGVDELYGTWLAFACENPDAEGDPGGELRGVVPFEARCTLESDGLSEVTAAEWRWGDGGVTDEVDGIHTYERPDNYGIRVEVSGTHPTCGAFERTLERFNYVRACGAPVPSFRAERRRGLEYRLINDSDVSTYGCHTNVRWTITDEAGALVDQARVWEPVVVFPEDGRYEVELALEGPGGETIYQDVVDTREGSVRGYTLGNGCTHTPWGGLAGLWLAVGAAAMLRRRRRAVG